MTNWLIRKPFAHRGLHGPQTGFVENSLSAFSAAADKGFGIELDVLISRDNKAMVIHDDHLERLTGTNDQVINREKDELQKLNLIGSNDCVPSLKLVLDSLQGKTPILIEIKGDQKCPGRIAQSVWEDIHNYQGSIAIMSFYPEIIEYFFENHPDVTRGLVATTGNNGELPPQYTNPDFQLDIIERLNVDFIAYDIDKIPNKVTSFCRNNRIPVLTWTVRTDKQRTHAKLNTDNIIFEL